MLGVIKTHHKKIIDINDKDIKDVRNADINTIITAITFDILKESPRLVADVANGIQDICVLEKAIIMDIDKQKYHQYHLIGLKREDIVKKTINYMYGYGPLQDYVENENISDIDITRYNEVCIKEKGVRREIDVNFGNEQMLDTYCKLLAQRNRGILDENNSHCRVTDEKLRLRINISIRPRNVSGPSISIRKHRLKSYTLDDLVVERMIDDELKKFFMFIAQKKINIIICGSSGSGKTTLLRAIINNMPLMDRVLIAESDAEIYPDKKYCIEQRIKKENEGGRQVTLRDIIRDGLTMSLDTYVIGEIVGDECWEFVRAIHSGHRGLSTTHARSADDGLMRLVTLSKGANIGESERTVKEMIGRSVDLVIFMDKFKVIEISEVKGYIAEHDTFATQILYKYEKNSGFLKINEISDSLKDKF